MSLKSLEEKLNSVQEKVDKLDEIVEGVVNYKKEAEAKKVDEIVQTEPRIESKFPVPQEYREVVNTVLNHNFGIQIEPMSDSPAFTFTIIVPDKYSTLTPAQKEMHVVDIRPRVISYADGLNGVKMWTEKVLSSFNTDMRVLIAQDRK